MYLTLFKIQDSYPFAITLLSSSVPFVPIAPVHLKKVIEKSDWSSRQDFALGSGFAKVAFDELSMILLVIQIRLFLRTIMCFGIFESSSRIFGSSSRGLSLPYTLELFNPCQTGVDLGSEVAPP